MRPSSPRQHGNAGLRRQSIWRNKPSLMDRAREVLGQDWWPYGIDANRKAIEAILRYHYEQGITSKRFTMEEIFVPELLST